ncbi:hypothetical protein HK103_006382 [Boothiomyces macroporosus]|uniref:peptide-methionine (R)-S-oxide reductase n=1 Tax=Boothiomyces macroporosus TaxID=261099 RepID=A0AAD5UDS2_9FUNG|nr:hypothetical protein HK103_006382 [Boothiomyces macroporosus]
MKRYSTKTKEEWKAILTDLEYRVMVEGKTEQAFTGEYLKLNRIGNYLCKGCNTPLFSYKHKIDTLSGWPTFNDCYDDTIETRRDYSMPLMPRDELICANCKIHLGHLFQDKNENRQVGLI